MNRLEAKFEATRRANEWLDQRLAPLRAQLRESERAVEMYRAEHNLVDASNGTTVDEQQLLEVNRQLVLARAELAEVLVGLLVRTGDRRIAHDLSRRLGDDPDPAVRAQIRRVTTSTADYFVGSVHAVTEAGEVVIASRTGSQVAPYAYSARNVIWVVGAQKIVPTLEEALQRVRTHTFALEDERMKQTGAEGSSIGKILIFENEWRAGRVSVIIVRELLGF